MENLIGRLYRGTVEHGELLELGLVGYYATGRGNGRGVMVNYETLQKLAEHFGVEIEYEEYTNEPLFSHKATFFVDPIEYTALVWKGEYNGGGGEKVQS